MSGGVDGRTGVRETRGHSVARTGGVYLPGDKNYPGGAPFDPFKLADDADGFEWQKTAEIKHGRLAMVAMLGCFAQAAATREGPVANIVAFANDPATNNALARLG